ncbi:hypothetical protein RCL1_005038 [Eukaryota sp. TZLM3-RCL]
MLSLKELIGVNGSVPEGLLFIPNSDHFITALGCNLVIRSLSDSTYKQILNGHSDDITCFSLSHSGKYLVSGQKTHAGFVADAIVWNLQDLSMVQRLSLHRQHISAVTFSSDDSFVATLGGIDDNLLALWEFDSSYSSLTAVASSAVGRFAQSIVKALPFSSSTKFVTTGQEQLYIWTFDATHRKFTSEPVNMGSLRRIITSLKITSSGDVAYAGTSTGDVLEISLTHKLFKMAGPATPLTGGIGSINLIDEGNDCVVIVGTGAGEVVVLKKAVSKKTNRPTFLTLGKSTVVGGISAISFKNENEFALVTSHSNCYKGVVNATKTTIEPQTVLISSAHALSPVVCCFPSLLPQHGVVFVTGGGEDLRVWANEQPPVKAKLSTTTLGSTPLGPLRERVRIACPGVELLDACISSHGDALYTAWDDGHVRVFGPESGKLLFSIQNAHKGFIHVAKHTKKGGVSCISALDDCRLVTGGVDSLVRVWTISKSGNATLTSTFKEHRTAISSLVTFDNLIASCSIDGTVVLIDVDAGKRIGSFSSPSLFSDLVVNQDGTQAVTVSLDGKLRWFDLITFEELRELEFAGELCSVAISRDSALLALGHGDGMISIIDYESGEVIEQVLVLSKRVSCVDFAPNNKYLIATSTDGGVAMFDLNL